MTHYSGWRCISKCTSIWQILLWEVKAIYDCLTTDKMMSRCLHGMTRNRNESLHARIWGICPKHKNTTKMYVDLATTTAVAHYNGGYVRANLSDILGMTTSQDSKNICRTWKWMHLSREEQERIIWGRNWQTTHQGPTSPCTFTLSYKVAVFSNVTYCLYLLLFCKYYRYLHNSFSIAFLSLFSVTCIVCFLIKKLKNIFHKWWRHIWSLSALPTLQ